MVLNKSDPDPIELRRVADAPDAALELAAATIARQAPSPSLTSATIDPLRAARLSLRRALDADPLVSGWVGIRHGRAVALLAASLEIVTEDHIGYTYMHPRHASTPLSWWAASGRDDAEDRLPALVEAVAGDAREHGVSRLLVQTRPHDWIGASFWRRRGMWADAVLAGLRLPARRAPRHPDRTARPARPGDEDALVRLAFDEHEHHARHTRTGTIADQDEGPTRRELASAFAAQDDGSGALIVVDGADGTPAGSLRAMVLEIPEGAAGRVYLPARYGYIGLTSVAPHARGTGVGTTLAEAALDWFAARGLEHVLLHYVDDNALSRRFWTARGFSPLVVTLAGDILLDPPD